MSDKKQEIIDLEKQLSELKRTYEASLAAFNVLPQDNAHITRRRTGLQTWQSAAVAFFNAYDKLIALGGVCGADQDPAWYTDKAESAQNVLDSIEIHYRALFNEADGLSISRDIFKPSRTAYANMQRLVKETDPVYAAELRARFATTGIPTHGFDRYGSEKPATHNIQWRYFILGCFFAAAALALAFWGFALEEMKPHHYFILRWVCPVASAFSSGSFTGSMMTGSNKFWWSLAVAATGGFAVWLLTNLFLLKG